MNSLGRIIFGHRWWSKKLTSSIEPVICADSSDLILWKWIALLAYADWIFIDSLNMHYSVCTYSEYALFSVSDPARFWPIFFLKNSPNNETLSNLISFVISCPTTTKKTKYFVGSGSIQYIQLIEWLHIQRNLRINTHKSPK